LAHKAQWVIRVQQDTQVPQALLVHRVQLVAQATLGQLALQVILEAQERKVLQEPLEVQESQVPQEQQEIQVQLDLKEVLDQRVQQVLQEALDKLDQLEAKVTQGQQVLWAQLEQQVTLAQ
jgi:hypothetical protein